MLNRISLVAIILLVFAPSAVVQDFKSEQMEYGRVNKAYKDKGVLIRNILNANDLDSSSLNIFIRAFKEEHLLEIWGTDSLNEEFVLLNEYHICRISGSSGPKRRQGDLQVPEGCYHIDRFNPWSNFHLSFRINYPNASDRVFSDRDHPGGEIYIHGSCVTIGCIPMTDEKIDEIYIFVVEAINNGQKEIPVHIFPCRMSGKYYNRLKEEHAGDIALISFWANIEEAYLYFEQNKRLPEFTVDKEGRYCFH
jgi:murein L,D-transpeptidase YafK